ncbi:MAG: glycosyltransferase family 2 protein [Curvibacter sp.]|nr:glycosyltransferase family 2 protein [Curvibacter sp.]
MRAALTLPDDPLPLRIAVVIPCYRVTDHILPLLARIGPLVTQIFVVDDACPEHSGQRVQAQCADPRVQVLFHERNLGVGGAVMTGYRAALAGGCDVMVKLDGDGQMDPALIPEFVAPLLAGEADYTKGNRFFDPEGIARMPRVRLLGNTLLSFLTKFASGYWNIFDPTNGYTAIHADVARRLRFEKISPRYFFESDLLFRLNTLRAVVQDVPMASVYGDEVSNLRISRVLFEFLGKNLRNAGKRLFYNYYLRDMSVASLELPLGLLLFGFGCIETLRVWIESIGSVSAKPAGTIMLAGLPLLMGLQLLLAFIGFDMNSVPQKPLNPRRNTRLLSKLQALNRVEGVEHG